MTWSISLSSLFKLALATLMITCAALFGWIHRDDLGARAVALFSRPEAIRRVSKRIIEYRLDPAIPTRFTFSQPTQIFRIISNPVMEPGSVSAGESWSYAFQAELIGVDGRVIDKRAIYSRSIRIGANGKKVGAEVFYRNSTDIVGSFDEVRIAAKTPIAAVRLTQASVGPRVKAVDLRVYERRSFVINDPDAAFRRLNAEDQSELAQANAFPVALLTPIERQHIAENQWRPVGPLGIEGRDYRLFVLYQAVGGKGE